MEQDKENPSGKSIVVDDRKSESEEGRSNSIHDKEGTNQELGFPISTEEIMSSSSNSLQIQQEVKKEDDSSGGKQEPAGITETGSSSSRQQDDDPNPENKDSYFENMSGNLDVKVQLLKDCIKEKEKLEQDLAVLQQCLEMEIPLEEITEEVTLNTVLILESVKEHVRLIDLKTEEIQALTQEVDTGFNVSFNYYADRAESDEDNAGKKNEKVKSLMPNEVNQETTEPSPTERKTTEPSPAENVASDDSDTLEIMGSGTKKRLEMAHEGGGVAGDTVYNKLTDFGFFNKFEDDFDDMDVN